MPKCPNLSLTLFLTSLVSKSYVFVVVENSDSNSITSPNLKCWPTWSLCSSFKQNGSTSSHFSFLVNPSIFLIMQCLILQQFDLIGTKLNEALARGVQRFHFWHHLSFWSWGTALAMALHPYSRNTALGQWNYVVESCRSWQTSTPTVCALSTTDSNGGLIKSVKSVLEVFVIKLNVAG